MKDTKKRTIVAALLGNILEHYDKALYMLIAPFIASLFYPKFHPITALILAYLPVSFIFRPLGALFFGYYGDRYGYKRALRLSIVGMSFMILFIGLIPTYSSIGITSACILHLLRGMICFFAAGEGTAAALVLINQASKKYKDIFSSIYEMSSMIGVLIASGIITLLLFQDKIILWWRVLFIFSGVFGLIGYLFTKNIFEFEKPREKINSISLKENWLPFLSIIFVTGFTYSNYCIMSSLMNGYIPLVSSLTSSQVMNIHTWLICFDFLMLPLFGYLSKRYSKEKIIIAALILAMIFSIPLFSLLNQPTISNMVILRIVLVTWGIAIAAPYEYWMIDLIAPKERFRIIALGKAIGAQWIGAPAISISLWMFHKTKWVAIPSIYIMVTALGALTTLFFLYRWQFKGSFMTKPNKTKNASKQGYATHNYKVN
ncbi:MAG: Proline/betaine transporter [Chlamydiae bacterium]|nr:Proline/betaine transporter [Chlamydiota bacterium]